ncbi:hypothetical protein BDP27DRAFT_3865 [Rhodocollybia butyracea]|uniref:Uncharacterized protein n=1 Tax=Rhodocollybia butyracea TaxID=206335 RepID=A0A9P5UFH7_9AGAR|nr:hypothetical protein BDP27DRAFT_3865 [Rhodocollybia butyracea]
MASCFALSRQSLLLLSKRGLVGACTAKPYRRAIHASSIVSKKKTPKTIEIEDLFSEDAEPDLLSSSDTTATHATAPTPASKTPKAPPVPSKHLDPATRHTRFEELYQSVLPHLNPSVVERRKLPPMKYAVWTHLVDLAQNEEELKRVVELVPLWKDVNRRQKNKGGLEEQWGESVVRRTETLSCPKLALAMFSNHAKYQIPMSLPAARHLLHALHKQYPLEDVMTAAALYRVYDLTPVAEDLVSLGLVCRALVGRIDLSQTPRPTPKPQSSSQAAVDIPTRKRGTLSASKQVFEALVQSLRELISSTEPSLYSVSPHARTRALTPSFADRQKRAGMGLPALEKEKTWLKWCLKKIEGNLRKSEGSEGVRWLAQWRQAAGHVKLKANPSVA